MGVKLSLSVQFRLLLQTAKRWTPPDLRGDPPKGEPLAQLGSLPL